MERNDLLVRVIEGGFCVIGDQDATFLLDENLVLRFYAQVKDPYFSFYTQEMSELGALRLGVETSTSNAGVHKKNASLFYSTQHVAHSELLPCNYYVSSPELDDEMAAGHIQSPLFVDVCLAPDGLQQGVAENFAITFQARALHWKYYFFGDLASYELEIQDLATQAPIMFTNSNAAVVKNGKALLSQSPIMLTEAPKQKFQLKDKNNSGKVLLKRLPNAGVNRIGKEWNPDGQSFLVAEIYINQ